LLLAAGADAEEACDAPPDAALPDAAVLGADVLVEAVLEEPLADKFPADARETVAPRDPNDSIRDAALVDGAVPMGSAGNNVLGFGTADGSVVGLMDPNDERLKTCMARPPI
jgi:hypothetical protein